ncbi:PcfJ domain-containing protein [Flavilitoribacter nigricans]|uniref:PcfJ-like protein n=1 Tax=Flavilitoribacter nigricans (strain ATCC 23147 / DSM 23189 / NBRC 102662 / NCIMB 1420 / SS-2) TaxID=1122177 RepID=A0A2D0N390_FLAN2|nr:PcfJ domain-containing protein [Flavilitoribacter nigricans]PHN02858.1 hypothetical protein CRP01_30230 [Flavilitoribacter nigricans DSM 23189 = NBRC 102662]
MEKLSNSRGSLATLHAESRHKIYEIFRSLPERRQRAGWAAFERELDLLPPLRGKYAMPIRAIAGVCNDRFGSQRVLEVPELLSLFKRLLETFADTEAYTVIKDRCPNFARGPVIPVILRHLQAVFGIWITREYPHLARLVLHPYFGEKYSGLLDIPFGQFIQYAPPFVLLRLAMMSESPTQILWIRWIIRGNNIRKAPALPLALSKREAHWVVRTSLPVTFRGAFFYGIVKARGGSDYLFRRLYEFYQVRPDWDYLRKLSTFLARHRACTTLTSREFNTVMTFLAHRQQEGLSFRLKGRTLSSLLRLAEDWEAERRRQAQLAILAQNALEWPKMPIDGCEWERGKNRLVMEQLCTQIELYEEGLAMHHCVASYAGYCVRGESSIWSLRRYHADDQFERLVTLEVTSEREIVQASAAYNAHPREEAMVLIRQWAHWSELKVNF